MSDALQELRQIRARARKIVADGQRQVANGQRQVAEGTEVIETTDILIAALEGGVTDAEANRRRRGMGIAVWLLAGALAWLAELVKAQKAATAGLAAAGGTAAIVIALPPDTTHQHPHLRPPGTIRPLAPPERPIAQAPRRPARTTPPATPPATPTPSAVPAPKPATSPGETPAPTDVSITLVADLVPTVPPPDPDPAPERITPPTTTADRPCTVDAAVRNVRLRLCPRG